MRCLAVVLKVCLSLALLVGELTPSFSASYKDYIVATVNDEPITWSQLQQRHRQYTVLQNLRDNQDPSAQLDLATFLKNLAQERAQLQAAEQMNIQVSAQHLATTVARIAQQNAKTELAFRQYLQENQIPWQDFLASVRRTLILQQLNHRVVQQNLNITPKIIDQHIQAQSSSIQEYKVDHILIKHHPDNRAKARQRAQHIQQALQQGADFFIMAQTYSDAEDAQQGGQLGWKTLADMPSLFSATIGKILPGEVSPILHSTNGFHILQLRGKRSKGQSAPSIPSHETKTHVRHILIKPQAGLTPDQAPPKLRQTLQALKSGQSFSEVARQYSDDNTAAGGGDLGWVQSGQLVPSFETAMNALPLNQVSTAVRSPFGWHLIEVLERQQQPITMARKRDLIQQKLSQQQANVVFQKWLRQHLKQAQIRYKTLSF